MLYTVTIMVFLEVFVHNIKLSISYCSTSNAYNIFSIFLTAIRFCSLHRSVRNNLQRLESFLTQVMCDSKRHV